MVRRKDLGLRKAAPPSAPATPATPATPASPARSGGERLGPGPASRSQAACDWLTALPIERGCASRSGQCSHWSRRRRRRAPSRQGGEAGGGGGGTGGGCRFRNRRSSSLTRGLGGLGRVGPRRAGPLGVEAAWGRAGCGRR
ncbi:PREDICTED: ESX-1 secretion-associated protein EspK-like [Chinchilla lanigera]|uniref:ESX-1 secretion-associated protein EspK-like n=1 Tax=Chinchilla lanigera TaxID=34839 RepID=UPI000695B4D6|nr:PREDICTED: ESX-1 secretion-associated protein EspK-like [Chinchilla lanigera]